MHHILTPEEIEYGFTENGVWAEDRQGLVWRLQMNRTLTAGEKAAYHDIVGAETGDNDIGVWDEEAQQLHLPSCLAVVKDIAPDTTVKLWWHRPFLVVVKPLYLPEKVYEMLNCMSSKQAKEEAKKYFHEQFKHTKRTAIMSARLATKNEMKKFVEDKLNDGGGVVG